MRTGIVLPTRPDLCSDLPNGSHESVHVRCTNCAETFWREYRYLYYPHECPLYKIMSDGEFQGHDYSRPDAPTRHKKIEWEKWCLGCEKYLKLDSFSKSEYTDDRLTELCYDCLHNPALASVTKAGVSRHQPEHIRAECKILHQKAILPTRKRTTDVAYDLYSVEETNIPAHGVGDVPTGIALSVPEGYFYTIEGRSGLWRRGILPFRGIIDATYTGELFVGLQNKTGSDYLVEAGHRVAQFILQKSYSLDIVVVEKFGPDYRGRDDAGFGSSGL